VKEKYGQAALSVVQGRSTCCGTALQPTGCRGPITSNLYDGSQTSQIPEEALLASLGCGNPTALAELKPGETVLDLVLEEAFRVLKSGGRFAVSDIVVRGEVPAEIRRNMELWVGCMAGALEESDYVAKLTTAGFEKVSIEPTRVYRVEDVLELLACQGIDVDAIAPQADGKFISGFVRARKSA